MALSQAMKIYFVLVVCSAFFTGAKLNSANVTTMQNATVNSKAVVLTSSTLHSASRTTLHRNHAVTTPVKPSSSKTVKSNPTQSTKTKGFKPTVKVTKVPNPEVGIRIVIIFLAIIAFIAIAFLLYFLVRNRRRRLYREPPRNGGLRTAPAENTHFDNPIQFPSAAYGNAVI